MQQKKTLYIIVIIGLFIVIGVYLNRAYAHIYNKIDAVDLTSPDISRTYVLANKTATSTVTYVAMGDSLTAGVGVDAYEKSFPYLLAQKISADKINVTLKNVAVPGAKTVDVLSGQITSVIGDTPGIITLLIGINDIHGIITKAEFAKNYDQILQQLTTKTKAKIYVVGLPLVGADTLLWPPYNYYFDWQTKEFNKIIKMLAVKYNTTYVDLYAPTIAEFRKNGLWYSADLFHPSAQGYALWTSIIYDRFD